MPELLDFVKFFSKDIVSGSANKVGDRFVAHFLIGNMEFEVIEHHDTFFVGKAL